MFSKLNQEFASHQKGFQILLGIVIIVPFVLMIPGVDLFGGGGGVEKPAYVGSIAGEEVDWDSYESEAKNVMILQAIYGEGLPSNYTDTLMNSRFQGQVLNYMAEKKIINSQLKSGLIKDDLKKEDYTKFINQIETYIKAVRRIPYYKVADQIESIRVRLRVGGPKVDEAIKFAILRNKINDALEASVKVSEEDLTAEVKKQERTFKLHEAAYPSTDFSDVPLKEYYEKNKEKYFRKDAVKASLIQVDFSKFEEAYSKLNVKPELDKFVADELKTANVKDPKIIESTTKAATEQFKQNKLKELAKAKAEQIMSAFSRSVKGAKDSSKFAETIKTIAKQSDYSVQDSVYVDPADVKDGKFFMNNEELSKKILEFSVEKPVFIHEGFRSVYVVVFNDKGAHAEFASVRSELLKAVYDAEANNYYITNKEKFKRERTMKVGLAEFTSSMFVAETKVSDEDVKAEYDKVDSYKKAQRKLIQFVVNVDKAAKDEEKKELEAKLKAFVEANKDKTANDIENVILKADDVIKKSTLNWQAQDSLNPGTNTTTMDAAFKAEVGQFTEILKDDSTYAVLYVAAKRENTPFEEVKGEIKNRIESELSMNISQQKAKEFYSMLNSVSPNTVEGINKAIKEYQKSNAVDIRYIDNVRQFDQSVLRDPGFSQFIRQMHAIPADFYLKLSRLDENRTFSNVRSIPPAYHKAVGFVAEIKAEHYADFEEENTKQQIYEILNENKAKELAAAHAVKVKLELEKLVEDKEKLKAKLEEFEFKKAADIKFKNAKPNIQELLKDSPKADFIASDSKDEGAANTVVYVEAVTEVSEEDLKKTKEEHEKNLKKELGKEKVEKFWEAERKKHVVKVPETTPAES